MSEPEREHGPAGHPAHPRRWIAAFVVALCALAAGIGSHEVAQRRRERAHDAAAVTGGDPARAPAIMRRYGCAGCHEIPGVPGASGRVGPPLRGFAGRRFIGGVVTNEPDHLVAWIRDPKQFDPRSAMPAVGVSEAQARDLAAYLYTLW